MLQVYQEVLLIIPTPKPSLQSSITDTLLEREVLSGLMKDNKKK